MLAEGIKGGFAMLYDTFAKLETLGVCRRGYFIEGMGGAQFALPGRGRAPASGPARAGSGEDRPPALVLAAADPAQPYGAALPWPKREGLERRPARVAGAYVVLVREQPVLYVERGGRGLITLLDGARPGRAAPRRGRGPTCSRGARGARRGGPRGPRREARARAHRRRAGDRPRRSSELLVELGFQPGPRRLTLSA